MQGNTCDVVLCCFVNKVAGLRPYERKNAITGIFLWPVHFFLNAYSVVPANDCFLFTLQPLVPWPKCLFNSLTPNLPMYRKQLIDLICKSIDWFLHDGNFGSFWTLFKCLYCWISNTFQRHILNRVQHLRWSLFAEIVNYFRENAQSWMFDWVLNTLLICLHQRILPNIYDGVFLRKYLTVFSH